MNEALLTILAALCLAGAAMFAVNRWLDQLYPPDDRDDDDEAPPQPPLR